MNPMVGGQAMLPDRDIMENMTASPMHSSFVTALKDTGVAGALKSNGQFTVFAPTNAAFAAAGNQPKSTLARRMSYLIVPGKYDSQALLRVISEAGGEAKLRTAEGGTKPYRAFVTIPGHLYSTFSLPQYRAILMRGIAWAGKRDPDMCTYFTIPADHDTATNDSVGTDPGPGADFRARTNDHARGKRDVFVQRGGAMNAFILIP